MQSVGRKPRNSEIVTLNYPHFLLLKLCAYLGNIIMIYSWDSIA